MLLFNLKSHIVNILALYSTHFQKYLFPVQYLLKGIVSIIPKKKVYVFF